MSETACSICGQVKNALTDFYPRQKGHTAMKPHCKACDGLMIVARRKGEASGAAALRARLHNESLLPDATPFTQPAELRCWKCDTTKPSIAFARDRSRPTGRDEVCLHCRATRQATYREGHRDQDRERSRQARQAQAFRNSRDRRLELYGKAETA